METIDPARLELRGIGCEAAVEPPFGRQVLQRIIELCDGALTDAMPCRRVGPSCHSDLEVILERELIDCGSGLVKGCPAFGEKVGPICPFDPIDKFDKMKVQLRLDELQVRVRELEVRLGAK